MSNLYVAELQGCDGGRDCSGAEGVLRVSFGCFVSLTRNMLKKTSRLLRLHIIESKEVYLSLIAVKFNKYSEVFKLKKKQKFKE